MAPGAAYLRNVIATRRIATTTATPVITSTLCRVQLDCDKWGQIKIARTDIWPAVTDKDENYDRQSQYLLLRVYMYSNKRTAMPDNTAYICQLQNFDKLL